MDRLGHGKIDVTLKYYTHVTDEMHDQVAAIMDTVMGDQELYDKNNIIQDGTDISQMAVLEGTEDAGEDNEE